MDRKRLVRVVLSMLIGWGVWAGLARAGAPEERDPAATLPNYYPKTPPDANVLPPGYPPVDNSPKKFPIAHALFYHRPVGCWSSFNAYSCSSLKSEVGFIFGSCRTFYSEPCLKGPPPSPLPPWAGQESGYHQYPPRGYSGDGNPSESGYPGYGVEARPSCRCR
jgi:hypothetical protein